MSQSDKTTEDSHDFNKASRLWILISAIPFQIGSLLAILWVLRSCKSDQGYAALFLIPFIGPIIAYVLMQPKNRYIASMSEWVFLGQLIGTVAVAVIVETLQVMAV